MIAKATYKLNEINFASKEIYWEEDKKLAISKSLFEIYFKNDLIRV